MDKSGMSLDRMRTFVRVVELGSLSAAGRELGLAQPTVTRHVNELEAALGVALLSRNTRRLVLTDEGRAYYSNCLRILRLVEQSFDEARSAAGEASGSVRISCTSAFGILHVSKLIFAFQDRYPDIQIDLNLTDERIDLTRHAVDLAIRLGPLTDSDAKLRSLGRSERVLVAAKSYLDAFGRPVQPADLAGHQCIRMSNIVGSERQSLVDPDGRRHQASFGGRLKVDHGLAAREALVAGRGIVAGHIWLIEDLLRGEGFELVLPRYRLDPVPLSMLIAPGRGELSRVRLAIDFLAKQIAAIPGIAD